MPAGQRRPLRAPFVADGPVEKEPKALVPEALFDASKIDLVTVSPDGTRVDLIIVNDSAWTGSDAQVMSLQQKIHSYVGFALDGQMAAAYPQTDGLAWRIVIDNHVGPIDSRSNDIVRRVGEKVRECGGELLLQ